jgi:1,4-dihydroxy-2-naphthoate octaprenyltransferase
VVVILGKKKAVVLYHMLVIIVCLLIILYVTFGVLPSICLVTLLSLPLTFKAIVVSKKNFDKIYELFPANAATIGLHSLIGLLLCTGFVLDKNFKKRRNEIKRNLSASK